ncbi:MAG: hypothetical protein HY763_12745 [Planctomycetes bacterium]|nr:hypothetical protein [Planctomycetota bacterium]
MNHHATDARRRSSGRLGLRHNRILTAFAVAGLLAAAARPAGAQVCACDTDVNADGLNNAADVLAVAACVGAPPVGACAAADVNCSGVINAADTRAAICGFTLGPSCDCCTCYCDGDVEGDGDVDFGDMVAAVGCIGVVPIGAPCESADVDCNGIVNEGDADAVVCLFSSPFPPSRTTCCNCGCDADADGSGAATCADTAVVEGCFGVFPTGACLGADVDCNGAVDEADFSAAQCVLNGGSAGPCCGCQCMAEVNGDGIMNVADALAITACLGDPRTGVCAAADVNCSGFIDAADVAAWQCRFQGGTPCVCCAPSTACPTGGPHLPAGELGCSVPADCPAGFDCVAATCYAPRSRYLAFVPNYPTCPMAFQVTLAASALFPGSVGGIWWVDAPNAAGTSRLVAAPVFRLWPEPVIHVADCEVTPAATYAISAFDGVAFSAPLLLDTVPLPTPPRVWGDTVGINTGCDWSGPNGVVNVNDFLAALWVFMGASPVVPPVPWVNVAGGAGPPSCMNDVVNFLDIYQIILAFQGATYPYLDPALCPACPP